MLDASQDGAGVTIKESKQLSSLSEGKNKAVSQSFPTQAGDGRLELARARIGPKEGTRDGRDRAHSTLSENFFPLHAVLPSLLT